MINKNFKKISYLQILFGVLSGLLGMTFVFFTGTLFQTAFEKNIFKIYIWIFVVIGVFVLMIGTDLLKRLLMAKIFPYYYHQTRINILKNFFSLIPKRRFGKGSINNALFNDLPKVVSDQSGIYFSIAESLTSFALSMSLLFYINWIIGLSGLLIVIIFILMPTPFFKKIGKYSKKKSEINEKFYGISVSENKNKDQYLYTRNLNLYHENMIKYVDTFGKQKIKQDLKLNIIAQIFYFTVLLLYNLPLILGAIFYHEGNIKFGDIAILTLISDAIIWVGTEISNSIVKFASVKTIKNKYKYKKLNDIETLEFIGVSPLSNKKRLTNKSISLKINKNKNYLLKGENGSGKSSLINILDHNLKYKGKIKINGKNVKNLENYFILRPSQKFFLFNSLSQLEKTIDVSENKIYQMIKKIVEEHINISKVKNNPSQGELQILSLLHFLANKPKIIIMDETLVSVSAVLKNKLYEVILKTKLPVIVVDHTLPKSAEGVFDEIISF